MMPHAPAFITIAQVKTMVATGDTFSVHYVPSGTKGGKPAFRCIYTVDGVALELHSTVPGLPSQPKIMAVWPGVIRHHLRYGGGAILKLDLGHAQA